MTAAGLGNMDDWLPDRVDAEKSIYQPTREGSDQQKPSDSKSDSTPASENASKSTSKRSSKRASVRGNKKETNVPSKTAEPKTGGVTPPPAKKRELRTQFNHRLLLDRAAMLEKYKNDNETTMQAVVDQMVDEYLTRRGFDLEDK